jgi:hypothetical protein
MLKFYSGGIQIHKEGIVHKRLIVVLGACGLWSEVLWVGKKFRF